MPACLQCGEENPERARFCLACGAALVEAEPAREERKRVTVLFADLVGFTSTAERLDPEEVRALQAPYWARVKAEIERYGGTVEKFIGDAVMALFGAPVAHEDDPERAVRAALTIRDRIAQDDGLQVRIAVTTGEALVSLSARPAEGEGMASGDVVNTASRLQSAAPTNGILVDETTYRATALAIEYREAEPVEAKGKAKPVAVWEAVEPRWRFGVDVEQAGGADLVGRSEELDLLTDALARARRERASQLVTLVGVPGIGKSRLVFELSRVVDDDPELIYWRQGRSLPYGEGVTFWALSDMVKAHASILETDDAADAERKLRAAVAEVISDPIDVDWALGHLKPLVGLGAEADASGDRRAEVFAAWRKFFEALAERGPLVLVFDDLQWADDGLLDFVDHLVEWASGVPLMCVCTARPELLERRPGWGGGKRNATTISLSPLSESETAKLIGLLMERSVLPAELQSALLARAGGNPLYAEEYVRMVQDRGVEEAAELPESIQGIIAARLDALTAEEKDVLQDAAVLGKVVWVGALADIAGLARWTVEERLHALERKEFVRREQHSSVAGETEYAFRHILVRDVAYNQIPRSRRGQKHRAAAEWIESLGRAEEHAELLAHHYLEALEYAKATGQDPADLAERGRLALREAGLRASELAAPAAATRFFEAALELWPGDDPDRAELMVRGSEAAWYAGHADLDSRALAARDAARAAGRTDLTAEAELLLANVYWHQGDHERSSSHLAAARALAEDLPAFPYQGSRPRPGVAVSHALFRGRAGRRSRPGGAADGRDARPRGPPGGGVEQHRHLTGEQRRQPRDRRARARDRDRERREERPRARARPHQSGGDHGHLGPARASVRAGARFVRGRARRRRARRPPLGRGESRQVPLLARRVGRGNSAGRNLHRPGRVRRRALPDRAGVLPARRDAPGARRTGRRRGRGTGARAR